MRTSNSRGLESPCVNTQGVICPKRRYPRCMAKCEPMIEFQEQLRNETLLMSSSHCEGGGYQVTFQNDGVAYR